MFKSNQPLFALAFRPFFLFGSIYAVLAILYWSLYHVGVVTLPPYFEATAFHSHEMLFGFVGAILAGFLLTASKNWASTRGIHGSTLMVLVLTWFMGRAGILLSAHLLPFFVAITDLIFFPYLCVLLWQTLSKGAKKMNFIFVFLVLLLFIANLLMHLDALGLTSGTARTGYLLGVDTIVVVMTIIGGRVIPMFTQNAVPGVQIVKRAWLEKLVIGSTVGFLLSDLIEETASVTSALAVLAGVAGLLRLGSWKSIATLKKPILWVLHLGYFFLGAGLISRGLSVSVFAIKSSIPMHLVTAGAMGLLILGMISRVSLGHTGRPLVVSRSVVVAYWMVSLGAMIRVLTPLFFPSAYVPGLIAAAVIWAVGFGIYAVIYFPILTRPRIDGLEG